MSKRDHYLVKRRPVPEEKPVRKRRINAKNGDGCSNIRPPDASDAQFTVPTPESVRELAVDDRKQKEISDWFNDIFVNSDVFEALAEPGQTVPRFALVKGPAGCGKTTAIRLIAQSLGIHVREYMFEEDSAHTLHPDYEDEQNDRVPEQFAPSHTKKFETFLKDSDRYARSGSSGSSNQIILVEDLPHVFVMRPIEFQSIIRRFVRMYPQHTPVVFMWTTCTNSNDMFRVFPSALITEFNFKEITFNPTSNLMLKKALNRLPAASQIPKEELETLMDSCAGDMRMFFNEIELRFKYAFDDMSPGSPVNKKRLKRDPSERILSQRQLFGTNFHFFGKIIYPKRLHTGGDAICGDTDPQPRRFPLVTSPRVVSRDIPCSTSSLIVKLHQNYIRRTSSIEEAARCSDLLSVSEMISRADFMENRACFQNYAADISIAGLMYAIMPILVDGEGKVIHKGNNSGIVLQRTPVIYSCTDFCNSMKLKALSLPLHQSDCLSCHKPADLFTDILPLVCHPEYLCLQAPSLLTAMVSEMSAMEKKCGSQSHDDDGNEGDVGTSHNNQESYYVTRKLSEVRLRDADVVRSRNRNVISIKGLGESDDPDDYQIDE
jgi:cell cycle checkpoint protein